MPTSDLAEARRLLEQAEAEKDPARKFAALEEGFEILEALATERTISNAELNVIRNVRHSAIRRLLKQLTQMPEIDLGSWLDYVRLLVTRFDAEVHSALENDKSLKDGYSKFVSLWGEEFLDILQRSKPG